MAIVSRELYDFDPKFSEKRIKFAQTDNVSVSDGELTTIGNLYGVLSTIFAKYPNATPKHDLRFVRPSDAELEIYSATAKEFFDGLGKHFGPFGAFFKASEEKSEAVVHKYRTVSGGHVLFRPIGLKIFAEVTTTLLGKGYNMTTALTRVADLPSDLNGFPYKNIIWKHGKIAPTGRALARDILLYMLGLRSDSGLRQRIAKATDSELGSVRLPKAL